MSGIFSSSKAEKPKVVKPVTDDSEEVKAAAMREAEMLKKRKGYASTIVTGNAGVQGTVPGSRTVLG